MCCWIFAKLVCATVKLPSVQRLRCIYLHWATYARSVSFEKVFFISIRSFFSSLLFQKHQFYTHSYQRLIRALLLKPLQRCHLNLSTRIQRVCTLWFNICWHFRRLAHEIGNVDTGWRVVVVGAVGCCCRCNQRRIYCHHHRRCKPDRNNFARAIMTNIIIGFIRRKRTQKKENK